MDWPAIGLAPDGNVEVMTTRIAARVEVGAGDVVAAGAGPDVAAGLVDAGMVLGAGATEESGGGTAAMLPATEVEELAEAGVKLATVHC
jgi:pyrimidine deaminase RibD-like protein